MSRMDADNTGLARGIKLKRCRPLTVLHFGNVADGSPRHRSKET